MATMANKRKCESKQSSSTPEKVMKAQKEVQPETTQNIPTTENKCGVKIHVEAENQDTEMKNKGSAKDHNNKNKVLDENVKDPQEDQNNQEKPIESKESREEKNEVKDTQAQENDNQEKTKADTLDKNAEFTEYLRSRASLSFPTASGRFYAKEYEKTTKNIRREQRCVEKPASFDKTGIVGLQRSSIEGNLEENIESFEKTLNNAKINQNVHNFSELLRWPRSCRKYY